MSADQTDGLLIDRSEASLLKRMVTEGISIPMLHAALGYRNLNMIRLVPREDGIKMVMEWGKKEAPRKARFTFKDGLLVQWEEGQ